MSTYVFGFVKSEGALLSLTDGMEVDADAMEAGQFEDADVEH